jgi:hypothetical protein
LHGAAIVVPARGAVPFLRELADQNTLLAYLAATRADLALSTAQLGAPLHVKKMNSMLTKVHAMASEDGLPIYDSRVAAAIAALVEVWRRVQGTSASPLPALLTFPPPHGSARLETWLPMRCYLAS